MLAQAHGWLRLTKWNFFYIKCSAWISSEIESLKTSFFRGWGVAADESFTNSGTWHIRSLHQQGLGSHVTTFDCTEINRKFLPKKVNKLFNNHLFHTSTPSFQRRTSISPFVDHIHFQNNCILVGNIFRIFQTGMLQLKILIIPYKYNLFVWCYCFNKVPLSVYKLIIPKKNAIKKTTHAVDKFPPSIQGRNFLSMSPKQDHIGFLYCIRIDWNIRFHMFHTNTDPHIAVPGIQACIDNVQTEI